MTIHQEITFKCSPAKIYRALTTSSDFAAATGAPADIASVEGGAFSCFGGQILGRNVELNKDQRIVQAWRVAGWTEGVYSIVRFTLEPSGNGTKLTFDQSGHPEAATEELDGGWHKMYWEPLKAYCG